MRSIVESLRRSGAAVLVESGGPAIWAIAALSVILLAIILWKVWRFSVSGVFGGGRASKDVDLWRLGFPDAASAEAWSGRGARGRLVAASVAAMRDMPEEHAREEIARVAKRELADARSGLRAIELIALIAPLLGLLGTVLGMIAAFRTLQEAGGSADPADLAGGIWEALLTTAAGMAVAIPASIALTWFEGVTDRLRQDLEDLASRIITAPRTAKSSVARAAE